MWPLELNGSFSLPPLLAGVDGKRRFLDVRRLLPLVVCYFFTSEASGTRSRWMELCSGRRSAGAGKHLFLY